MLETTHLIDEAIEKLQNQIDDTAIIACSGGIDSSVAAVLASRAVGDLLHCVYVDTGLMRKNETEEVERMLAELGIKLTTVYAADRYFEALVGVTEPEEKRHIIGELFIRIFEDEQKKVGAKYLVQGTIAPDWIESGGGERDVIKSHHNVGGLPDDVDLIIVEPLRNGALHQNPLLRKATLPRARSSRTGAWRDNTEEDGGLPRGVCDRRRGVGGGCSGWADGNPLAVFRSITARSKCGRAW